jgi:uncharacterized membrane protein
LRIRLRHGVSNTHKLLTIYARGALWTYSFSLVAFVLLVLSNLFDSSFVAGVDIGLLLTLMALAVVSFVSEKHSDVVET